MSKTLVYRCMSNDCNEIEPSEPVELDMKESYTRVKLVCMACEQPMHWVPRYAKGARVWLSAFEDQPRELAVINPQVDDDAPWRAGMYSASVKPHARHDDGERELSEDQIESVICPSNHIMGDGRCSRCGKRWVEP